MRELSSKDTEMTMGDTTIKEISLSDLPLWAKTREKRTLLSVAFELTARCNNDCRHCYINLPPHDPASLAAELTTAEIKSLVDEAISLGALWFLLTGGEPLLRHDFSEIYTYIRKKGGLISLFTNAALISDDHIRLFRQLPPRDIEVTIYGVTPETHEQVTRQKHFAATVKGLERLFNFGIPVTLKSTIMRSNFMEFPEIARYCREKSHKPFRFDPFLQLRIDRDEQRNRDILSERLTAADIIEIENSDPDRREALQKSCGDIELQAVDPAPAGKLFRCQAGLNSCCISHDGMFKLCSALAPPACTYDLKRGSLREAWYDFTPGVRALKSNAPAFIQKCAGCRIIDLCMWCPAHADLECGHMDEFVPAFCEMAERRKKALGKIE